ncbi:head-tail connector protein [Lachnoclostridium sp.]|uniref:head-tail connector protein n=1 Tax=Lachnoclostridium sp. TaxID=2028282 RepID=UPI00289C193B|nr:head-tail connector protein [Lachnoclostridium sp.]
MKVSEVQVSNIAEYLRFDDEDYNTSDIQVFIDAAKAYIRSYTGLDDESIDTHEDITIALYVLCQDMHNNRSMYVEKSNVNKVVDTILGMYCINLL